MGLKGHFDAAFKELLVSRLFGHIEEQGETRERLPLQGVELAEHNLKHPLGIQVRIGECFGGRCC